MEVAGTTLVPYINNQLLNVRYSDLDNIVRKFGYERVLADLNESIKNGSIIYPLKQFFMPSPLSLINNKTQARFELREYINDMVTASPFLKDETRKYQGKEIALVFRDSDYERLDIITDYYTEMHRIYCNVRGKSSPRIEFKNSSYKIAKSALDKSLRNRGDLDTKSLSDAIYDIGIKMCTTFKVSVAIAIYDAFRPVSVFVPFEGWGDKLIAAYLSETVRTYVSTDPNKDLKTSYQNITNEIGQFKQQVNAYIYDRPIEDLNLTEIYGNPGSNSNPDLIFGSPPYSDYENYGKDADQSTSRYPKYKDWLDKWFLPTVVKLWSYVKPGGHLVYHMGYIPDTPIIEPFVNLVTTFKDGKFLGQIPLINGDKPAKRPVFLFVVRKN